MSKLTLALAAGLFFSSFSLAQNEAPKKLGLAGEAENALRKTMEESKVALKSVSCPEGGDYSEGKTVICPVTDIDGTVSNFSMKIVNKMLEWKGDRQLVDESKANAELSQKLSAALSKKVEVKCEDRVVFQKDNCGLKCKALVDGKDQQLTISSCKDAQGKQNVILK